MANILTDDVQTYVTDLIAKEFVSIDIGDQSAVKSRKTNNNRYPGRQKSPEQNSQSEDMRDE